MIYEYNMLWSKFLNSCDIYAFYHIFKIARCSEIYLYSLDKRVFRNVYIRFRMGVTQLFVHKYRYTRDSDFNTYLCPACYERDENESHFLVECPVYDDLRNKFLRNLPNVSVDVESLLKEQNPMVIRAVARYLYFAFQRREEAVATAVTEEAYTPSL